jgi:hypothetical protein
VRANVLGTQTFIADTGPQKSTGAGFFHECSLLTAEIPGTLKADVVHAATVGQGDRVRSEAAQANLRLMVGGNTINADFLMARAMARLSATGCEVRGASDLAKLVVNGTQILVTGQPNQVVPLPNGQVVVNYQGSWMLGLSCAIHVAALYVVVDGVAQIAVSEAYAEINGPPPTCPSGNDLVTAAGSITASALGATAFFGVAAGVKSNGELSGHLVFVQSGPSGLNVKGTSVTAYTIVSPATRHIEGAAEVNGQAGVAYQVDVTDNGDPNTHDRFVLRLSNGYMVASDLLSGCVQLHLPCG